MPARASTAGMIRFGSMLEDLECYVDNSVVWSEEEGRIVGRRGGIRQWLRENAPDLSERYKTVMKYKALAKKFRQAVGVSDPVPAAAVLPSNPPEESENGEGDIREHCSEQDRKGQVRTIKTQEKQECGHRGSQGVSRQGILHVSSRVSEEVARTPEEVARTLDEVVRTLLAACEGTVASLAAQLALMVSADFVPDENIDRTRIARGGGNSRSQIARRLRGTGAGHVRSSA